MHNVEITSNILKEFFSLFRSKKTDLLFIFRVWCDCIDRSYELGQEIGPKHFRFEFLSADLYGLVADDLPPMSDVNIDAFANRNFTFPEVNQFDGEGKPDSGVLQRLESELGFRISGLDAQENNLKEADYLGYELKSKRLFNSSYISLFSKSPSYPAKANSYLREKYGEVRDENYAGKKKLYASVFGHRHAVVYEKYKMKLELDYVAKKLYLRIFDLNDVLLDSVFWTFESLEKASRKMKSLLLVLADTKIENNQQKYHYNKAEIYEDFNFESFLKNIENGGIMFDIRIGVHNSGKNIGKTHDHGSGFRVKLQNFKNLYCSFEEL